MIIECRYERSKAGGFSLMELAIVLMIIGTLMSGVLVAVSASVTNTRITDTRAQLREIEEALYGFAQTQGRLPCPSDGADGFEAVTVPGGDCVVMHGFVPSATLGLYGATNDDGLLLDSWSNPFRYSLFSEEGLPDNPDFSSSSSINNFFNNVGAVDSTNMLEVKSCSLEGVCAQSLTNTAPAVVLSMGANWLTYTSINEGINAGTDEVDGYASHADNELVFNVADYSEENFDDQIVWLSPYVLFNRLINAGKLP
jgi:prepilin-type N-terminal cleavage/methylation domain-containing protein